MANVKITDLTALTQSNIDPAVDVVPIVDVSVDSTRKATPFAMVHKALWAVDGSNNATGMYGPNSLIIDSAVSVAGFGATGDGTTVDTTAIQNAVNSGAKVLRFEPGKTYITELITIPNTSAGLVILAYGATIKLKASSTTYRPLLINASAVQVYGGTWDGNRANQTVGDAFGSWGIGIGANANDVLLFGCEFTNIRGTGVKVVNCNRATIQNCRFTNIGATGNTTGTATSGGASTLTDTLKTWATNQWTGAKVRITSGTGSGQTRTVSTNTSTTLTVSSAWATQPDATSGYVIDQTTYGVYAENSTNVNAGHRVLNCYFDFSSAGIMAQPVLFTSGDNPYTGASTTNTQRDWEIIGNYVLGSTSASNEDQAICLCVRGRRGIVANNVVIGGSMGWSEGGPETIITGNIFREQTGTLRWGIEYSGARMVIANNWISAGGRGIENSFGTYGSTDDVIIEGNYVEVDASYTSGTLGGPRCITLQVPSSGTGRNTIIRNNTLKGKTGIVTTFDVKGMSVQGNKFIGPGSGGGTYAISCEGAPAQLFFDIQGNTFSAFQYVVGLYAGSAVTYTDLYFANNNLSDDVADSAANYVRVSGSAAIGSRIVIMHNREKSTSYNFSWYFDRATLRGIFASDSGVPNGVITASPGSLYLNTAGGTSTVLYIKETGSSTNTGWVAK